MQPQSQNNQSIAISKATKPTDFIWLGVLGTGSFSQVHKVRRTQDGQIYALKKIKLPSLKPKQQQYAITQIKILAAISCPFVVAFRQAFYCEAMGELCIVMEWANQGDLQGEIQRRVKAVERIKAGADRKSNGVLTANNNSYLNTGLSNQIEKQIQSYYIPQSEIWRAIRDILTGLKLLHSASILHRDIKTANIFKSQGLYKLGDLNIAKICPGLAYAYTQTGTPYYASPEVWKQLPYDTKSDIWSFGCVIYQMCELRPPFVGADMSKLYESVVNGKYRPVGSRYSRELRQVVGICLEVDPKRRYSCEQFLDCEWVKRKFAQYNIRDIQDGQSCLPNNSLNHQIQTKQGQSSNKQLNLKLSKQLRQLRSITEPTYKGLPKGTNSSQIQPASAPMPLPLNSPAMPMHKISNSCVLSKNQLDRMLPESNYPEELRRVREDRQKRCRSGQKEHRGCELRDQYIVNNYSYTYNKPPRLESKHIPSSLPQKQQPIERIAKIQSNQYSIYKPTNQQHRQIYRENDQQKLRLEQIIKEKQGRDVCLGLKRQIITSLEIPLSQSFHTSNYCSNSLQVIQDKSPTIKHLQSQQHIVQQVLIQKQKFQKQNKQQQNKQQQEKQHNQQLYTHQLPQTSKQPRPDPQPELVTQTNHQIAQVSQQLHQKNRNNKTNMGHDRCEKNTMYAYPHANIDPQKRKSKKRLLLGSKNEPQALARNDNHYNISNINIHKKKPSTNPPNKRITSLQILSPHICQQPFLNINLPQPKQGDKDNNPDLGPSASIAKLTRQSKERIVEKKYQYKMKPKAASAKMIVSTSAHVYGNLNVSANNNGGGRDYQNTVQVCQAQNNNINQNKQNLVVSSQLRSKFQSKYNHNSNLDTSNYEKRLLHQKIKIKQASNCSLSSNQKISSVRHVKTEQKQRQIPSQRNHNLYNNINSMFNNYMRNNTTDIHSQKQPSLSKLQDQNTSNLVSSSLNKPAYNKYNICTSKHNNTNYNNLSILSLNQKNSEINKQILKYRCHEHGTRQKAKQQGIYSYKDRERVGNQHSGKNKMHYWSYCEMEADGNTDDFYHDRHILGANAREASSRDKLFGQGCNDSATFGLAESKTNNIKNRSNNNPISKIIANNICNINFSPLGVVSQQQNNRKQRTKYHIRSSSKKNRYMGSIQESRISPGKQRLNQGHKPQKLVCQIPMPIPPNSSGYAQAHHDLLSKPNHQSLHELPRIRNMLINRSSNIRQQIGKLYYNNYAGGNRYA